MKLYKLKNYTVMLEDDEKPPEGVIAVFSVDDVTAEWINKGAAPIVKGKTVSVDEKEIAEMVELEDRAFEKAEARRKEYAHNRFLNAYAGDKEMAELAESMKTKETKSLDKLLIVK